MPGLLRRLTTLLHTRLETLLEPAEDPRTAFADSAQRQHDLLARVREALARNSLLRRQIQDRVAQLQAKLPKLEELAKQTLAAGREDLTRLALQQRQLVLVELKSLETSAKDVQLEEGRIAIIEQRLATQIEAMRMRQEITAVRYSAAESQVMVSEAISGASRELADLDQAIEQAEQNADHMQARASAIDQLTDFRSLDPSSQAADPIAKQLSQMDMDRAVEKQLAELKRGQKQGVG